jgi:hypothetical protein
MRENQSLRQGLKLQHRVQHTTTKEKILPRRWDVRGLVGAGSSGRSSATTGSSIQLSRASCEKKRKVKEKKTYLVTQRGEMAVGLGCVCRHVIGLSGGRLEKRRRCHRKASRLNGRICLRRAKVRYVHGLRRLHDHPCPQRQFNQPVHDEDMFFDHRSGSEIF